MSIRNKITIAVNQAFKGVKDLAQTVTLKGSTNASYDFSTGTVSSTTSSLAIEAIVILQEEDSTDPKVTPIKEVYAKESELPNPKLYDKIEIDSLDHSILSYSLEPGLVILKVTEG